MRFGVTFFVFPVELSIGCFGVTLFVFPIEISLGGSGFVGSVVKSSVVDRRAVS